MKRTPETAWRKSMTAVLENVAEAAKSGNGDNATEWAKIASTLADCILAVNVEGTQSIANSDGADGQ